MSARALKALQPQQVATLDRLATILPLEVYLKGGRIKVDIFNAGQLGGARPL